MKREKLLKERKKRDLKQWEVAELIGISRIRYNRIEKGVRNPKLEEIESISKLYGKPVEELFFK
jgi:putative transcriptional regulator